MPSGSCRRMWSSCLNNLSSCQGTDICSSGMTQHCTWSLSFGGLFDYRSLSGERKGKWNTGTLKTLLVFARCQGTQYQVLILAILPCTELHDINTIEWYLLIESKCIITNKIIFKFFSQEVFCLAPSFKFKVATII